MKSINLTPYSSLLYDDKGYEAIEVNILGAHLLRLPLTNKGTAFTQDERDRLHLNGLLPARVSTLEQQVEKAYKGYLQQGDDIAKYQYLRSYLDRMETLFYRLLEEHLEEMMPIIYTPTVGRVAQEYSQLFHQARGLIITPSHLDCMEDVVNQFPLENVRMIVATDSSAILGIGDQGIGGMAICIGKLALYTLGAGISPYTTVPVCFDLGTDREELLTDSNYLGVKTARLKGAEYDQLIDAFVGAVKKRWSKAVIQWEDFTQALAFNVLNRYRENIASFNDDIQGTGAVVLAGLLSACRKINQSLTDQRILVVGAGAGGVGVAKAIQDGLVHQGLSRKEAIKRIYVLDASGLVISEDLDQDDYRAQVAQPSANSADWMPEGGKPGLEEVLHLVKPTVLLGLTGVAGLFTESLVKTMTAHCERPIIFPLSNPTSNCEAEPEDIIHWSQGKALVASGSPFNPVKFDGQAHPIGQGNNAFVFPGIGFATVLGGCSKITDEMIIESAFAVADYTDKHHRESGLLYPPISELHQISCYVTERVLGVALKTGVSERTDLDPENLSDYIKRKVWKAYYRPFIKAKKHAL